MIVSPMGKEFILKVNEDGVLYTEEVSKTINIEEIKLDTNQIQLIVGESIQLKAILSPDNVTEKIIWASSDENIATVVEGVVTTLSPGEVIITVFNQDKTIYDSCVININESIVSEGLVCHIDAKDFFDNSINDRINNLNFVTYGNPILKESYLYFDGIDDMIYATGVNYLTNECTISVAFNEEDCGFYSINNNKHCKIMWCGQDFRGYNSVCIYTEKISGLRYRVRVGQQTISPPNVYYDVIKDSSQTLACIDLILDVKNKIYKVYRNGKYLNKSNIEVGLNNLVAFGGVFTTLPYSFAYGNIGSFKVYNRMLTDNEIEKNYKFEKTFEGSEG